jgi:hypothetical protein
MGAEREDTDPTAKCRGTEPGLGKSSGPAPAAAVAVEIDEEPPPPVDFDALHAALGDPLEYDEELEAIPEDGTDLLDGLEPAIDAPAQGAKGKAQRVGESSGRSSASDSSARPHTIPPTRAPVEDPNAPAVIVASDTDTVPSAPPQMTVPLGAHGGIPGAGGPMMRPSGSGPHVAAHGQPSSGPHAAAPSLGVGYAHTPQPFQLQNARGIPQMTMRMPDRPVNMRRGKTPTIVVRPRGPSAKQKLLVFMTMLLLVTACGIAVIIWRKPKLLNLEPFLGTQPAATSVPAVASTPAAPSTPATPSAAPSASAGEHGGVTISPVGSTGSGAASAVPSASAAPSASASAKKLKPPPSRPVPLAAPVPAQ